MSEPFVGEIRMFAGNFAPVGHALCDGQLMAVSQNEALFSLLGTTYGGDGRSTFGLPDLRGRIPIHYGHGPGLSNRNLGLKSGAEDATITANQIPSHGHPMKASADGATSPNPQDNVLAEALTTTPFTGQTPNVDLALTAVTEYNGGGQSHNNVQPFLCVNFIITLFGAYPSRN